MTSQPPSDRQILKIGGADRIDFLQGLVTNDLAKLSEGLVYAAILTPQGKYLADFFMVPATDSVWLDVKADLAPGLVQRLSMYKLRADVTIETLDMTVSRGIGNVPDDGCADPRHPAMGWRLYGDAVADNSDVDWTALRVEHGIPESGIELIPNDSYILECGFERLNGVDFKKGCYVGQEVTARMKHKTELRKGLARVKVDGAAQVGTEILKDGKSAGTLYSQADGYGLAYLRFDRAGPDMTAGDAKVHYAAG